MGKLYDNLINYADQDFYPFHMPGHKRNKTGMKMENPFRFDITEIEGFDDLHHSRGILKDVMEEAAQFYGVGKTYFLVNGSTCGILAAIAAVTKPGGKALIARNSHKSAYNALYLGGIEPVYVYPETDETFGINGVIRPEDIKSLLSENPDILAVFITSPTYEGVVSDIKTISEIVHSYHIPLIVDEAHGAHFGMHKAFPQTAVHLGADIIIQSIHKTLPSLTQTALLHVNSSSVLLRKLERFLSIYQSSSPSYVLLSSIDSCISSLRTEGIKMFDEYVRTLLTYRNKIDSLKNIRLLKGPEGSYDCSKIVLSVKGTDYTGARLYGELLENYHIQTEMVSSDYLIVMTSCMDTEEGFLRLYEALNKIDMKIKPVSKEQFHIKSVKALPSLLIGEALERECTGISLDKALGKICGEYIYLYPPGIPIMVPGEVITCEVIEICREYERAGLQIEGLESGSLENILIVKES